MAYRLSMKKKQILVSIHVLSLVAWLGGTICMLLLGFYMKGAENREQLYYTLSSMNVIDVSLLKYPALVTLLTGILLSIWTQWGLIKHYWVLVKWILTFVIIIFSIIVTSEAFAFLLETVDKIGFISLQNKDFQIAWLQTIWGASINIVAMIFMTFITYLKPFGKVKNKK
ncbi:hypothetical protein WQ54_21800 [Bacillus sp. SA1-12]|uniref:hypothetical protein n=1 Tax=Bacillus sp. SA1-12 TaxID=1455638 RepID=UPI0006272A9E|nr:hypothetical protein [Bacillus sp. SA1-12]KKI90563.1 hypothetical protein WQ54_21800 [Bacillus sp. SA1-12]